MSQHEDGGQQQLLLLWPPSSVLLSDRKITLRCSVKTCQTFLTVTAVHEVSFGMLMAAKKETIGEVSYINVTRRINELI